MIPLLTYIIGSVIFIIAIAAFVADWFMYKHVANVVEE